MTDDLTIFLPLKGRHLHTLRWLWHADRTGLPYRVIVADGEVHPTIERLLSDPGTFPRLRFTYHRYDDKSFRDFYRKCAESLNRVGTRYAMISDNDDFVLPTGVQRCMAFLDGHADFVCAIGGIPGFSTAARDDAWQGVTGPLGQLRYRCHDDGSYESRNLDQASAPERVLAELRRFFSLYYGVYRAEALRTIAEEIQELDFSDLLVHEFYGVLRTVTFGKVRGDGSCLSYLRQGNTSLRSSFATDWVDHLLRSRFPQDFQGLARKIAHEAVPSDEAGAKALETEIYREFAVYLRRMLAGTVLRHRFPRLFKVKQALLAAKRPLARARPFRAARQDREFWQRLARDGASQETIAAQQRELAEVKETLAGDGFVRFVESRAPDLLARGAR